MGNSSERWPLCERMPLQPQSVLKRTLLDVFGLASGLAFFALLFLSFIVSALRLSPSSLLGISLLLLGGAAMAAYFYEYLYFRRYFYGMGKDVLVIRKGVFTLGETTLPFERIQDVFIDRDVLDQALGLYDLHVSTATIQSGLNANIDGLSFEGAEGLKRVLLQKMLAARRKR